MAQIMVECVAEFVRIPVAQATEFSRIPLQLRRGLGLASHRDKLSDDAGRNFWNSFRADVQPDRSVDSVELLGRRLARFDEMLSQKRDLPPAAEHADICGRLADAGGQVLGIGKMPAADDRDVSVCS